MSGAAGKAEGRRALERPRIPLPHHSPSQLATDKATKADSPHRLAPSRRQRASEANQIRSDRSERRAPAAMSPASRRRAGRAGPIRVPGFDHMDGSASQTSQRTPHGPHRRRAAAAEAQWLARACWCVGAATATNGARTFVQRRGAVALRPSRSCVAASIPMQSAGSVVRRLRLIDCANVLCALSVSLPCRLPAAAAAALCAHASAWRASSRPVWLAGRWAAALSFCLPAAHRRTHAHTRHNRNNNLCATTAPTTHCNHHDIHSSIRPSSRQSDSHPAIQPAVRVCAMTTHTAHAATAATTTPMTTDAHIPQAPLRLH